MLIGWFVCICVGETTCGDGGGAGPGSGAPAVVIEVYTDAQWFWA